MLWLSDLDWNPDHYVRGVGNGLLLHESRVSSGEEQSGHQEHGALSAPVFFAHKPIVTADASLARPNI